MKTPKLGFIPEKYMHMRDFHVKKPNQTKPKTHKTKNPTKNQINKQTKKGVSFVFMERVCEMPLRDLKVSK